MILQTCSEGITLAKQLESGSASFYEEMARRQAKDAGSFSALAEENKKNVKQIDRTYYGVITDAIEGCFAFRLETDDYALADVPAEGAGYADILEQAIVNEDTIIRFYTQAAEQSRSLMADVPRLFALLARKRQARREKLAEMLASA